MHTKPPRNLKDGNTQSTTKFKIAIEELYYPLNNEKHSKIYKISVI